MPARPGPYAGPLDPVQTAIKTQVERDYPWLIAKFSTARPHILYASLLDRQCRARGLRWCAGCRREGQPYRGHAVRGYQMTENDRICRGSRKIHNAGRVRFKRTRQDH